MQKFPHHYKVTAASKPQGDVCISAARFEPIASAAPIEFDGPGNRWSPESLLVAAVADCFTLSFRSVASASKLAWTSLQCEVEGKLEQVEGVTKFTAFEVRAKLKIPQDTSEKAAQHDLEKADAVCLIANSLSGKTHLKYEILKSESSKSKVSESDTSTSKA